MAGSEKIPSSTPQSTTVTSGELSGSEEKEIDPTKKYTSTGTQHIKVDGNLKLTNRDSKKQLSTLEQAKETILTIPENKTDFKEWMDAQRLVMEDKLKDGITNKVKKAAAVVLKASNTVIKTLATIKFTTAAVFAVVFGITVGGVASIPFAGVSVLMFIVAAAVGLVVSLVVAEISKYAGNKIENYRQLERAYNAIHLTMLNTLDKAYESTDNDINYKDLALHVKALCTTNNIKKLADKFNKNMLSSKQYYPANDKKQLLDNIKTDAAELISIILSTAQDSKNLDSSFIKKVNNDEVDGQLKDIIKILTDNMSDKNSFFNALHNMFTSRKGNKGDQKITNEDFNKAIMDGFKEGCKKS